MKDMRVLLKSLRHRRKIMAVEHKGNKCQRCGYDGCYSALEFHHRDPSKKSFGLSCRELSNRTWEACLIELDKCDLLCSNCHRETEYGW